MDLIDCDHKWSKEILRLGYIQPVSYIEVDPIYGIETRIKFDLVSKHGEKFFIQFIKDYQ